MASNPQRPSFVCMLRTVLLLLPSHTYCPVPRKFSRILWYSRWRNTKENNKYCWFFVRKRDEMESSTSLEAPDSAKQCENLNILALNRSTTSATWTHSSFSSLQSYMSNLEYDDSFHALSLRCQQYRKQCLLLDEKHRKPHSIHNTRRSLLDGDRRLDYELSCGTSDSDVAETRKLPSVRQLLPAKSNQDRLSPVLSTMAICEKNSASMQDLGLDRDEIRRQQEILDSIQRANLVKSKSSMPEAIDVLPAQRRSMASTKDSFKLASLNEDVIADIGNGKKMKIKGTQHTYKSIVNGQATIVQCPGCKTILQISSSAKLLYCSTCSLVSSIQLAKAMIESNAVSCETNKQIAYVVQRQEINIAQTLKQPKD